MLLLKLIRKNHFLWDFASRIDTRLRDLLTEMTDEIREKTPNIGDGGLESVPLGPWLLSVITEWYTVVEKTVQETKLVLLLDGKNKVASLERQAVESPLVTIATMLMDLFMYIDTFGIPTKRNLDDSVYAFDR
jgi:hypothetical protein